MSKATMTVEGFLSADPEFREAQGKAVANFSVPHQARRLNKQSNQWEDVGDTLWVRVALWEGDAELAREHLSKGVLVRVEGEPVLKSWESGDKSGTNLELKFASWSIIPRKDSNSQGRGRAVAGNDEPWAATPPPTLGGGFNDETPF